MKVLVVTGASGGHIFPALSFLEALKAKDRNIRTVLVLPYESLKKILKSPAMKSDTWRYPRSS
jgi:UDP-N-acetylglucosamine:LPS N-acetylglucosamine transferase